MITVSPIIVGGQAFSYNFQWTPGTNTLSMVHSQPVDMLVTYEGLLDTADQDTTQIALNDNLMATQSAQANADSLSQQLAEDQLLRCC
jgi:hypothetical protein